MKALVVVIFALLTRPVFAEIVDEKRLEQALLKLPGTKLDSASAAQLVAITINVAKTDLDPFILLAQLYIESRFDSTSTSRLIGGSRRTGSWNSRKAPPGWSGTLYCGIAQTVAITWSSCLRLREPRVAITAQADELRRWHQRSRSDLHRSLAGYGCGNRGFTTGRCNRYSQRVQAWAKRLRYSTNVVPLS